MKTIKSKTNEILSALTELNSIDYSHAKTDMIKKIADMTINMGKVEYNCFLSYTWSNKQPDFVQYLSKRLNRYNDINTWLDKSEIHIGEHIYDKISNALSNDIHIFICVLSSEYLESFNCKAELSKAHKLFKNKKIILMPIVYSNCDIPLELEGLLVGDFRNAVKTNGEIIKSEFNANLKKLDNSIRYQGKKNFYNPINIVS